MDLIKIGKYIASKRKALGLTQAQLAEKLGMSSKSVSKWERGRGFPDISLIETLAETLQVSVPELLSGEQIINANRSANLLKSKLYVCPVCGNIIQSAGTALISCCGVTLPPLEAEEADEKHALNCEIIDHEYYLTIEHPMTKSHYISFAAYCIGSRFEVVKLYPEGSAEARFFRRGHGILYWYCNQHGLFCKKI